MDTLATCYERHQKISRFPKELWNLASAKHVERREVEFRMARKPMTSKVWIGISVFAALSVMLALGWWLGRRTQSVELNTPRSQIRQISSQSSVQELQTENDDLIRFVDEAYALLREEGIHIQLDLDQDQDGHYRLRADSAKVTDELKAKLREINEQ
jgi:hypothetical protein